MCGISGYYKADSLTNDGLAISIEQPILNSIQKILNHRGPDNFGSYYDNTTGLAHNRLSLLDLSPNGNQPFENDNCVFIYNGEVYNYLHLKKKYLSDKEIHFRSNSDTEVLFYLLQYYSIDTIVQEFDGMFAFAYYDKRTKKLYLVRDKLGIKPLFYLKAPNGRIYFSSEKKSFFSVANLEVNEFRNFYSLFGIYDSADENTVFNNVFHLKPGHYLEIAGNNVTERCYFRLRDFIDPAYYAQQAKKKEKEIYEEFDHLLSENIKSMLVSDAPMGAFVSGGIDSSLIAALAAKQQPIDLFTANVVGPHSEINDARTLSKHLNLKLHEYEYLPEYLVRDFVECTWHMEAPIVTHANGIPFSGVAKLAHDRNVKAVLTGEGADELFLGYPHLLTKRYNGIIKAPINLINWIYKKVPLLAKHVFMQNENNMYDAFFNVAKGFQRQRIKEDYIYFKHVPIHERKDQFLSLRMMQEHLLSLLWRNDRMGMIASIESRFPFLGDSMVRFALNLPLKHKIGYTFRLHNYKHPFLMDKKIVRKCCEKYLPESIVRKRKNGFPMKGLAALRPEPEFFKGGILQSCVGLNDKNLNYFLTHLDVYTIGKFISLETFHKLFVQRMDRDAVQSTFQRYVKMR